MTDKINIIIGQNIRNRRRKMCITQKKLSLLIGISYQQLHKYEVGVNAVSAAKLKQLSEIFECGVQDFYYDVEADFAENIYKPSQIETQKIKSIIRDFVSVDSPSLQEHICVIVRNIALEYRRQMMNNL